jgi:hypothetical protein
MEVNLHLKPLFLNNMSNLTQGWISNIRDVATLYGSGLVHGGSRLSVFNFNTGCLVWQEEQSVWREEQSVWRDSCGRLSACDAHSR